MAVQWFAALLSPCKAGRVSLPQKTIEATYNDTLAWIFKTAYTHLHATTIAGKILVFTTARLLNFARK